MKGKKEEGRIWWVVIAVIVQIFIHWDIFVGVCVDMCGEIHSHESLEKISHRIREKRM
jgi:hypothetical protein